MPETVSPTRMRLLQRQNQVGLAQQGVDLLKRKRDAAVADFFNVVRRAVDARDQLIQAAQRSYALLGLAKALEGREVVEAAALADPRRLEIAVESKTVWGTRIPTISAQDVRRSLMERGYDPANVSARTVESAEHFEEVVSLLLDVATTELALRKVGDEIRRTTRRVNALEQVVIPRIQGEIRYIRDVLEQRAREDVFRLKRNKKKLEAIKALPASETR
jgi:V/A-type H+-transporting ATPase subunit D